MTINDQEDQLNKQAHEIYAVNGVADIFHPPESSNYIFMLVPKALDRAAYSESWSSLTTHLNQADKALLQFCCSHLEEQPDLYGLIIAQKWHQCMLDGVNLQGGRWADELIRTIEKNGSIQTKFSTLLKNNAPDVVDKFLSVPDALLEITRFNLYLDPLELNNTLEKIVSLRDSIPFSEFIERIEIAKTTPRVTQLSSNNHNYPRLILYINRGIIDDPDTFQACTKAVKAICDSTQNATAARKEYAYKWLDNCTVTEGFVLFKRYLAKLDLIEHIYSAHSNYGMRQNSKLEALVKETK